MLHVVAIVRRYDWIKIHRECPLIIVGMTSWRDESYLAIKCYLPERALVIRELSIRTKSRHVFDRLSVRHI